MGDIVDHPASSALKDSSKPLNEPPWLAEWRASERPPATAEMIEAEIERFEESLRPADSGAIGEILEPLSYIFEAPPDQAAPIYLDAVSDIPGAMLDLAVQRCILECRTYPKPVDIRERATEYRIASWVLQRLRAALRSAQRNR